MIKVVIVTDGPYGDRTYDTICEDFETVFLELEQPDSMFMDDVEVPDDILTELRSADLVISYILHPDLVLEMVEQVHEDVGWIIVAAWRGEGLKNQLEDYGNVTCPDTMCELEENGDPVYDEFVSKFGRPVVEIQLEGNKVVNVDVIRAAPCGSTHYVSREMVGEDANNLPTKAGLKVQIFPCRAPKLRLFVDECKKGLASNFHSQAFQEAIDKERNS
jgi:hypothetical protein